MNNRNDQIFWAGILAGVAVCIALYSLEAVHFYKYGWREGFNVSQDHHSQCKLVDGSDFELDCPVEGYGVVRVRRTYFAGQYIYAYKDPLER